MPWPRKLLDGTPRAWNLDHLYRMREAFREDPDGQSAMFHADQEWLMGYILPPFQRPLVWDEPRMIRFLESAILGLHIGTWVYNNAMDAPTTWGDGREIYHRTDKWLIDGQQRLTALDRFFDDAFPVFGYRWSEVGPAERRRFLNGTAFQAFETAIYDEDALRELYDRLNFGGVSHTADQRASRGIGTVLPTGEGPPSFGRR